MTTSEPPFVGCFQSLIVAAFFLGPRLKIAIKPKPSLCCVICFPTLLTGEPVLPFALRLFQICHERLVPSPW